MNLQSVVQARLLAGDEDSGTSQATSSSKGKEQEHDDDSHYFASYSHIGRDPFVFTKYLDWFIKYMTSRDPRDHAQGSYTDRRLSRLYSE
jgi:hypothetical protein